MNNIIFTLLMVVSLGGFSSLALAEAGGKAADAGHGADYRTFNTDGTVAYGQIQDSYSSDLVMYLAGNQFMAMQTLIQDFQSKNPDVKTVYVETIPPGQILKINC